MGSGEFDAHKYDLEMLVGKSGKEVSLFRVMSVEEYNKLKRHDGKFTPYDFAMDLKWFATSLEHVLQWKDLFKYRESEFRIIEIIVIEEALYFMSYAESLDNIGKAYAADVEMLNMIVRRVKYYE